MPTLTPTGRPVDAPHARRRGAGVLRSTAALAAAIVAAAFPRSAHAGEYRERLALLPGIGAAADTITTAGLEESAGPAARDLSLLAPEFRHRLERVIERMRAEFGDVEVVETLRSRERQEALFAQGRTRSGPVVTWTRNSAHLGGYAADVVVGHSYDNAAAYARLATIARDEGLRTLAPRDPGHVELPGAAGRPDYGAGRLAYGDAPAGSARALSRIVASRGVAPSDPTVFAASPYASAMGAGSGSFLAGGRDARDDASADGAETNVASSSGAPR